MSKRQSVKYKVLAGGLLVFAVIVVTGVYLSHVNIPILDPKGPIARQERTLIIFAALLSLVVVIPVYMMTFGIAWKYRETNKRPKKYSPDWDHSRALETLWWGIPTLLILILSVVTWRSTHALDPFKPINSPVKPLNVQVVALNWKWLFIYPEQGIASVNYLEIPDNTPINFQITSDATMNSFWIPQLSGQIYAMSGMSTELHVLADSEGNYLGRSANISGDGFAGMTFDVQSTSTDDFNAWVQSAKQSLNHLTDSSYTTLARPSQNNPVVYYASSEPFLYDKIVIRSMPDANTISVPTNLQ